MKNLRAKRIACILTALALILFLASAVIFYKHWENIGRLIRKEEIGLRSTIRGDKRMK